MIEQISPDRLLGLARASFALPASGGIDEALVSYLLRRAAGIHCPCSPRTLIATVQESLRDLGRNQEGIEELAEACLEGLMIVGDLLELGQVSVDDPRVRSTWVFAAPPSFVVRPTGEIFVIGTSPDEDSPLPSSLASKLQYRGVTRSISDDVTKTAELLRQTGMLEISQDVWLRSPKEDDPKAFRDRQFSMLHGRGPSGLIDNIELIDPTTPVKYYRGRWKKAQKQSGTFVARRPQAYGAPLWCLCKLAEGEALQILDYPLNDKVSVRWRGCDAAWHVQLAIDSVNGNPQRYRVRESAGGATLEFFSPLPVWARRRLTIFGRPEPSIRCLFSYFVPSKDLATEEDFLRRRLWLAREEN